MFFRSVLFTPADRLDRLPKALDSAADKVALDLEDGVGPDAKAQARRALSELAAAGFHGQAGRIGVRVSPLSTPDGIRDLEAMLGWSAWPGMILIPKVESTLEVRQVWEISRSAGFEPGLLATLETPQGLEDSAAILKGAPGLLAAGFGSADYTAQTGGSMSEASLAWARGKVVNSAAAAGIPALDGVWLQFKDLAGLERESERIRDLGFAGRFAIHPGQAETINRVFSPDPEAVAEAREMLAAFERHGGGALSFRGKMVDAPILARARRLAGGDGLTQRKKG